MELKLRFLTIYIVVNGQRAYKVQYLKKVMPVRNYSSSVSIAQLALISTAEKKIEMHMDMINEKA